MTQTATETIMMDILIILPGVMGMPQEQKLSHILIGTTPRTWDQMVASVEQIADNYTDEEPVAKSISEIPAEILSKCESLNLFVKENTYCFSINEGEAYAMVQNRIA